MTGQVRGHRLLAKAGDDLGIFGVLGVEHFDGDAIFDALVFGLVDGAHAAAPDLTDQAVVPDFCQFAARHDKPSEALVAILADFGALFVVESALGEDALGVRAAVSCDRTPRRARRCLRRP
jgi:hypothetical protein